MEITIGKLTEQILRRLAGGNVPKDFPISSQEIKLFIAEKVAFILRVQLIEGIKYDNNRSVNPHFVIPFEEKVKMDSTETHFYVDLPSTFIDMMGNRGIQRVVPKGGTWVDDLIPLTVGASSLFSGTPAGDLQGDIGFYPQSKKIVLYTPNNRKPPSDVIIYLLTTEDDSNIDPAVADMVRDEAVKFYIDRVPRDVLNDENSDIIEETQK